MGRSYDRNEFGGKNKVRVKIDGEVLDREFRNEGEARQYLEANGYDKDDIRKKTVQILKA